jgi:hypothetical protein
MDELNQTTASNDLINLLLQDGLGEGLPKIAEILMNAAMLVERAKHIGAAPHERVEARNGHANGFKPRTFHTSMGGLELATPQVRCSDVPFRTSLLEKGSRSDRALKAAIASMYLQGVSTRRVTTVMGELCGFEVSSTQVSNLTAELDAEVNANVTDAQRVAFMDLRGLKNWGDRDTPWNQRGTEWAAVVMQQGLSGLPLPPVLSNEARSRLQAFELLTGRVAPVLVNWIRERGVRCSDRPTGLSRQIADVTGRSCTSRRASLRAHQLIARR